MQRLPNLDIHLPAIRLSDLFFNYDHPAYTLAMARAAISRQRENQILDAELRGAVLADAVDFCCTLLGFASGVDLAAEHPGLPEALVDDFCGRL